MMRGAIHHANLIPSGPLNDQPDVYQPYLIMREHIIDRLYINASAAQCPGATIAVCSSRRSIFRSSPSRSADFEIGSIALAVPTLLAPDAWRAPYHRH
jgi:hypothetical protein